MKIVFAGSSHKIYHLSNSMVNFFFDQRIQYLGKHLQYRDKHVF